MPAGPAPHRARVPAGSVVCGPRMPVVGVVCGVGSGRAFVVCGVRSAAVSAAWSGTVLVARGMRVSAGSVVCGPRMPVAVVCRVCGPAVVARAGPGGRGGVQKRYELGGGRAGKGGGELVLSAAAAGFGARDAG
ncbi:hypothetical protein [Streptomyces brasiliensis]|uniref:Uncharacterized protein n=1 Tax=Streptomyces brasiliensis TaxID=1954 RepID=A0A917L8C0_9ACTN|nr:hypothetical protein [Streptomyces brasiliensis]GGJ44522.1 hypothetical protein GCM10010121_064660 [Streptomyces brasiliensis]